MKSQNINLEQIDHVIVSGGLAEMPKVQQSLHSIFGDKLRGKELSTKGIAPNFVTVYGCAMQAASLSYVEQFQAQISKSGGHQALCNALKVGPQRTKGKKKAVVSKEFVEQNAFLAQDYRVEMTSKQVVLSYVKGQERQSVCVIEKGTALPFTGTYSFDGHIEFGDTVFAVDVIDDDCKTTLDTMEQTVNIENGASKVEVSWDESELTVTVGGKYKAVFSMGDEESEEGSDDDEEEVKNDNDDDDDDTVDID